MADKSKISFSLIAYNEENNIKRCLESIRWADEIIVVDCGSTDKTVRIAKQYTKKIYHRKNNSNLNVNKSFGISKASGSWIFYIDPDEEVSPKLKNEIRDIINKDTGYDAFRMPRMSYYIFNFLHFGGNYPDYQVRFFKKGRAEFANRHVHEKLQVKGRTGTLQSPLLHYPYQSVREYIQKLNFYTDFQSDFLFQSNNKISLYELLYIIFIKSGIKFFKKYFLKLGFLDGIAGLFSAVANSITIIISNFKLYEKWNNNKT